jgi:putative ABC transport system permease protein
MHRMTLSRLRWLSVWHYRATNVAVVLGVMVGTAVMGGALIVGDSVRASLRQMTLDRLGKVDAVVTGPRFFREALVDELRTAVGAEAELAPALVLVGSVE